MAKFSLFGTQMTVARTPSWSKKGWVIKTVPTGSSIAQKRAQAALTDIAIGTRGQTGMHGGLPGAALSVASGMAGKSFGGKSAQEAAQDRYKRADATRARLAREIAGR